MMILSKDNGGYSGLTIRDVVIKDVAKITELQKEVAKTEGGIARSCDEIDTKYIRGYIKKVIADGVGIVCTDADNNILGIITAHHNEIKCNRHILENLTICIHPNSQSMGIGRKIFTAFLGEVLKNSEILKVKLTVRESNNRAFKFYEKMGFEREGILRYDAMNSDGTFDNRFIMSWFK